MCAHCVHGERGVTVFNNDAIDSGEIRIMQARCSLRQCNRSCSPVHMYAVDVYVVQGAEQTKPRDEKALVLPRGRVQHPRLVKV